MQHKKQAFYFIVISFAVCNSLFNAQAEDTSYPKPEFLAAAPEFLAGEQTKALPQKEEIASPGVAAENIRSGLVENTKEVTQKKILVGSQAVKNTIKDMTEDDPDLSPNENASAILKKQQTLLAEVQRLQNDNAYLNQRKTQLENDPHNKLVDGTILSINDFAVVLTVSTMAFVAICAAIGWKIKDLSVRANAENSSRVARRSISTLSTLTNKLLNDLNDEYQKTTDPDVIKKLSGLIANYQKSVNKRGDRDEKFADLDAFNRGLTQIISQEIETEKIYLGGGNGIIFKNKISSPKLSILNDMLTEVKKFGSPLGHSANEADLIKKISIDATKTKTAKKEYQERKIIESSSSDDENDDDDDSRNARDYRSSNGRRRSSDDDDRRNSSFTTRRRRSQ